ncbi:hypothetical protein BS50DRAFT_338818 [Corynespora cassiicola Philippines]|uniref:Uncharacterized protein n=1 Tax=Corynespora cassiicola Philippines TaxID=1448308 RepID=A0A2T2NV29_CORCC|nr:hypothetical protein BS50DRAFT_338818 [Corynespora cassiicola Philippines]
MAVASCPPARSYISDVCNHSAGKWHGRGANRLPPQLSLSKHLAIFLTASNCLVCGSPWQKPAPWANSGSNAVRVEDSCAPVPRYFITKPKAPFSKKLFGGSATPCGMILVWSRRPWTASRQRECLVANSSRLGLAEGRGLNTSLAILLNAARSVYWDKSTTSCQPSTSLILATRPAHVQICLPRFQMKPSCAGSHGSLRNWALSTFPAPTSLSATRQTIR